MKVEREVGRLLGQNTRASRLFEVKVSVTEEGFAKLEWNKVKPEQTGMRWRWVLLAEDECSRLERRGTLERLHPAN